MLLFASYVYIKTVFLSALNLDFSCISLTNYYYKILFILMRSHLQTLVFRVLFNRKSFFFHTLAMKMKCVWDNSGYV